jgi:hypothetical protein
VFVENDVVEVATKVRVVAEPNHRIEKGLHFRV